MQSTDLEQRLIAKSAKHAETGCLRWTGAHNAKGYGYIHALGKTQSVHRVAYELWVGRIPDGMEVDHVHSRGCRFRDCIEPTHLEAVTRDENLRRRVSSTHCPQGHEYVDENTGYVNLQGTPWRVCRECKRSRMRAWKATIAPCSECGMEMRRGSLPKHKRVMHAGRSAVL